jgi:4-amino-4-deoxy-L-arabinose transferase-like glycosyltransferase
MHGIRTSFISSFNSIDTLKRKGASISKKTFQGMRKIQIIILMFFISVAAWNSIDQFTRYPLYPDSGVFASGAFHLLKGKVLYKEIWENKQPMIYIIDGLTLWLFGITINSIRIAERIFAVMGVLLLFLILQKIYKNLLLSYPGCILFIVYFYQIRINNVGNFSEEYASIFILGGIACALYACESIKFSQAFCFGSGIFFSVAAFTKEPFILSSLPCFFLFAI